MYNNGPASHPTLQPQRACTSQNNKHGQRAVRWLLAVPAFLLATACNQYLGGGASDNPPGSPEARPHGPVPGLFATDEAWAVVTRDSDSELLLLVRGFGNTVEYVIAGRPDSGGTLDAGNDPEAATPVHPGICVGFDPKTATVSLEEGILQISAEFPGVSGQSCELALSATVCVGPFDECQLDDVELAATMNGEPLLPANTSPRLIRLNSCPKVLALPADGTEWTMSSTPLLPLFLSLIAAPSPPGAGEPNGLPFPLLVVRGSGSRPTGGFDTGSVERSEDGSESWGGCQPDEYGNEVSALGTVTSDGSGVTVDFQLIQSTSDPRQKGPETREEVGGCSVNFHGQIAYCAQWLLPGAEDGSGWQIYRVEGEGANTILDAPASQLPSLYIVFRMTAEP